LLQKFKLVRDLAYRSGWRRPILGTWYL
jgi:hypothetical protein